jgi:MFS transporter, DHA3 family, macrolide efflux protein
MVPQEHLSRVAGVNQALRGIIGIAAPPLGALLYSLLQFHWVLSVDIFTAILAILPLLIVKIPQPIAEKKPMVTPKQLWNEVSEGFKFLKSWPGAMSLLLIAMLINFVLGPSSTLLPLLIKNHFGGTAWHLGAIESVFGVGIILGGLLLGVWGGFKRKMITSLLGVGSIGVGIFLTGLAPKSMFWMAMLGYGLGGFVIPIANGPIHAIMQTHVPANMQGRVFTLIGSLATAMMPLSMIIAAPVAQLLGVRSWFLIGGVLTMIIGYGAFFLPKIVHIEDHKQKIEQAAAIEG